MSYAKVRSFIYGEIERERRMKISYMCSKCNFYIDEKCTTNKCVKEIEKRRNKTDGNSKNRCIKIKRSGLQPKN